MISIETKLLRAQADNLKQQSRKITQSGDRVEAVHRWLKRQEFPEANRLLHHLERRREELEEEQNRMLLMARALQKVCDKYDAAEGRLAEMPQTSAGKKTIIAELDLTNIDKYVMVYGGLNLTES